MSGNISESHLMQKTDPLLPSENLLITHMVLFPQVLHVSLLAADLPFPLSICLLSTV